MRWLLLLLLAVAAPLAAKDDAGDDAGEAPVEIAVERSGDRWVATFAFPSDEPGWSFVRSNRASELDSSWRLASWHSETPGVELVRIGERDVLQATHGTVPRSVRVTFEPFAQDIYADYDPALIFSDGTVALFTGHFAVTPWRADAAEQTGGPPTALTFANADGRLVYRGLAYDSVSMRDEETYVLFGSPQFVSTPHFVGLLDPQIPEWIRSELDDFLPHAMDGLADRLGEPNLRGKPMILASWAGPTPGGISRGGSVLDGIVTLRFEGEGMLERQVDEIHPVRWFLAHEAAHFWLGQTVAHRDRTQAWISEGGASLLAYRLIAAIDPAYEPGFDLAKDWQDCLDLSAGGALRDADTRRDYRANYACGAVLGMIAEGAAQANGSRDFFDFWRSLIDANRKDAGGDGIVSTADWIAQVTAESQDPSLAADLYAFIHHGAHDPAGALCGMLGKVGRSAPGCPR